MIENNSYAYDLSIPELYPEYVPSKEDFRVIKTKKNVTKGDNIKKTSKVLNTKLSLVVTTICFFAMCIITSIRYNIISEKNLELQRLKMDQTKVASELATTEVLVDKVIDKDKIEAYAKQQLGMQKPEKNQIVYVNLDFETKVEKNEEQNIVKNGINKLKNLIGIE